MNKRDGFSRVLRMRIETFIAIKHLAAAPRLVQKSRTTDRPIYYAIAMPKGQILLEHFAKQWGGIACKSPVTLKPERLKIRVFRTIHDMISRYIYRKVSRETVIFVNWGYSSSKALGFAPADLGFKDVYLESDLFGFGRDQNRAIVGYLMDKQRPHFDGRGPSDLEDLLNAYSSGDWQTDPDAAAFIVALRKAKMHKYSQFSAEFGELEVHEDDLVIFGQVESDAAWVFSESAIKTNVQLIGKALQSVPEAKTVYFKPHPRHKTWPQDRIEIAQLYPQVRQVDPGVSFKSMLVNKPSVFVNTSGTGLDAGLAGCQVYTAGLAFYSGWGATIDVGPTTPRRRNVLTFEDIVIVICTKYSNYFYREGGRSATLADITQDILQQP